MDVQKDTLVLKLFEIGAVKFGAFRLKLHEKNPEAPLSPIYIDLRVLRSNPDAMDLVADVYVSMLHGLKFDYLADVPTAATPIVALICHKIRAAMITPRITDKEHGTHAKIDGVFEKGKTAIVIDDLITKADSKIQAIQILEENGLIVNEIIVLVDREQGGILELENRGYTCHAAYKLVDLLNILLKEGRISADQYSETTDYFAKELFTKKIQR